jgi:hypothetical protein
MLLNGSIGFGGIAQFALDSDYIENFVMHLSDFS